MPLMAIKFQECGIILSLDLNLLCFFSILTYHLWVRGFSRAARPNPRKAGPVLAHYHTSLSRGFEIMFVSHKIALKVCCTISYFLNPLSMIVSPHSYSHQVILISNPISLAFGSNGNNSSSHKKKY